MTRRGMVVSFADEVGLLAAVRQGPARGFEVVEVFAPYPVHGLPEALAVRPSRLNRVGLVAGLAGLAGGIALQVWTSVFDWPANVGGRPLNSMPAFVPVAFELAVLFAGVSVVAAFLLSLRRSPRPPDVAAAAGSLDDRLVAVLAATDARFDGPALPAELVAEHGAVAVEERLLEDRP